MKSSTACSDSEASMSCSTYTVRSSSGGGKPSTWPLEMARMSVDCRSATEVSMGRAGNQLVEQLRLWLHNQYSYATRTFRHDAADA